VTEAGLADIEAALDRFEAAHRAAADQGDREAAAMALREVRYWRARRASAEVVKPSEGKGKASFGMTVTVRRDDGREQSFKIVGEDEADPSRGTVSYMSPLARAVLAHGWRDNCDRQQRGRHSGRPVSVPPVRKDGCPGKLKTAQIPSLTSLTISAPASNCRRRYARLTSATQGRRSLSVIASRTLRTGLCYIVTSEIS
jgi:transcription elongation GreA/GreB family factor